MGGMDSLRLLYCGAPLPPPPAIHLPLLTRLSVARSISARPCQLLCLIPTFPANPTEPIPLIPAIVQILCPGQLVSCRVAISFSYAPSNWELNAVGSSLDAEAVPANICLRCLVPIDRWLCLLTRSRWRGRLFPGRLAARCGPCTGGSSGLVLLVECGHGDYENLCVGSRMAMYKSPGRCSK